MQKISTIILAAGNATRMRSRTPKPLLPIGNRTIIEHALAEIVRLNKSYKQDIIIVQQDNKDIAGIAKQYKAATVIQKQQKGTAHAVLQCQDKLKNQDKILILFGDTPFTPAPLMRKLLNAVDGKVTVAVAAFATDAPNAYGRIILDENNTPLKIIEAKDATPKELQITLCNGGIMALHKSALPLLKKITAANKQKEYLLPHIVDIARKSGMRTALIKSREEDFIGVNSPEDYQQCEAIFQTRQRHKMLKAGVRMTDPATVYFSADTKIGADVTIEPFVIFGAGVTIKPHATIRGFSHIAGATIGSHTIIGPFARIRPDSKIADHARIGNFVEVKNSHLHEGAKASHLAYLGDSTIGAAANIGAGVITCNYDGKNKHRTKIGEGAFIGSNAALVAPLTIGKQAIIGAGSTITKNVKDKSLAIARTRQEKSKRAKSKKEQ